MNESIKTRLRNVIPPRFQTKLRETCARVRYFGLRYKCPFCKARLRALLPCGLPFPVLREKKVVGSGIRQNALCPVCFAIDRHRLLYLYLLTKTDIFDRPMKLLHVAPEPRVADILKAQANIDYLSADLCPRNVMMEMDITDIRFPEEYFDAIICNHVLGNIVNDRKAFSELLRTLKPGGWAILQVPISRTLKRTYEDVTITTAAAREQAFGEGGQVRIYADDYKDRLMEAGFDVSVFKWTEAPEEFGGRQNVFALNEDESVYFVRKPR